MLIYFIYKSANPVLLIPDYYAALSIGVALSVAVHPDRPSVTLSRASDFLEMEKP